MLIGKRILSCLGWTNGRHDYTQLARQFGAEVVNELSGSVTHIVAVRVYYHLSPELTVEKYGKDKRRHPSISKM